MSIFSSQKILNLKICKSLYQSRTFSLHETSLLLCWNPVKPIKRSTHTQASTKLAAVFTSHGCCGIFRLWNAHCEGFQLTQRSSTAWYIWKPQTGQRRLPSCKPLKKRTLHTWLSSLSQRQKKIERKKKAFRKSSRFKEIYNKTSKTLLYDNSLKKNIHPGTLDICTVLISTWCISIAFTARMSST